MLHFQLQGVCLSFCFKNVFVFSFKGRNILFYLFLFLLILVKCILIKDEIISLINVKYNLCCILTSFDPMLKGFAAILSLIVFISLDGTIIIFFPLLYFSFTITKVIPKPEELFCYMKL